MSKSASESTNNFTIYTPSTTYTNSDTINAEATEDYDFRSWVPSHGSTIIIRSASCGNVVTLVDGQVILAPIGGPGSMYWICVESRGWLGFRNQASHKFLCLDWDSRLKCTANEGSGWREFTLTPVRNKGYIMQMLDWGTLRPIVINPKDDLKRLGRSGTEGSDGHVWEFVKIDPRDAKTSYERTRSI